MYCTKCAALLGLQIYSVATAVLELNVLMSRFTGRAHEHEGKLIELNYSAIMEVGPAHHLIP
jgi:hypothetical protein